MPHDRQACMDAESGIENLLVYLGRDLKQEGLKDTPARVIKALAEMTSGYSTDPETVLGTVFEESFSGTVILDHIDFTSVCEHHLMSFSGQAHIGYSPDGKSVVGLSKLARLVDCLAKRLQVQERLTKQIAETLVNVLKPRGVAVVLEAQHGCVCARGVLSRRATMRTSMMLGNFGSSPELRAEFLNLITRGEGR